MAQEKKQVTGIGCVAIVAVLIVILLAVWFIPRIYAYNRSTSKDGVEVEFVVEQGTPLKTIAKNLKKEGLIKYDGMFVRKVKSMDYDNMLKYGTFELNTGMCMEDIIKELASGTSGETFTLTIPEGYSVQQIAAKLENDGICTKGEFFDALDDDYGYKFIDEIPKVDYDYKLQGFLFPSTYEFFKGATAHDIIDKLLGEFEREYQKLGTNGKQNLYDTVTVASLVEREARLDSERATIAGVIYNRMKNNMPLQIDAAIIYILSDGMYDVDRVLYKDLESDSLYNTYKNSGLPVGPICNPGLSSLKAAINPESHNYLYYHTDESKRDGSHIFTETYDDHLSSMD